MADEKREIHATGYRLSPGWLTFLVGLLVLAVAGVLYQHSLVASGAGPTPSLAATGAHGGAPSSAAFYTCPMHPQVVQDHPGTCPICGMELVPKTAEAATNSADTKALKGVHLSPTQEVMANVTPVKPSRQGMALSIPAIGEVTVPQDQQRTLTTWQSGRVDKLLIDKTGMTVKKGQHILDLYSEDLVQAQNEYLIALRASDQLGNSSYASIAASSKSLLAASRDKLLRMGMLPAQLATLETTRQVQDRVPVYARESGVVMDKKVSEGMYVDKGQELFTLAGLNPIWVELQVFESDIAGLRTGETVYVHSHSYPGKNFMGKVVLIEPELDPGTKTYKVRVAVDNKSMLLRPGMVVHAAVTASYGELLLLPRDAVLHTGDGDLVYVRAPEGDWRPRKVTVGRDFGDRVEIVSGVGPGEEVAGTAAFLLDSEAQLKGVARPVDSQ